MKSILLLALAALTAVPFTGCHTVAVVETPRPTTVAYNVRYYHGRPYYYSGRTRYWGYPPGYVRPGYRPGYVRPVPRRVVVY